jgi:uncharacterized protein (DUF1015 family)
VQILPSDGQPRPGLTLTPFRGLRYAPDRVSGLAEVTSPPYDVIAHDTEAHLLAADPYNVVRLILPHDQGGNPGDACAGAADMLRQWQEAGILVPDPEPALYVYEQSRPGGAAIQRGLIGALRLVPLDGGPVLPHEDVAAVAVTGRRRLMEATGSNLEPIFLLYDGATVDDESPAQPGGPHETGTGRPGSNGHAPGTTTLLAAQAVTHRAPLVTVDTADRVRHRLWALTDPAEHAAVAADLATRQALIADGHHRYAAYLELQARKRAADAGAGPWDAGLALLVDSAAFPPRLGAIHRVISGLSPAEAVQRAKAAFTVEPLPGLSADTPAAAVRALREASKTGVAFLVASRGEFHLLTDPDPAAVAAAMPGRSAHWRNLSAAVLQELLLARLWGVRDDEATVEVHHDAAHALRATKPPSCGTAVLCPPLSAADVRQVAAHGERVPRKSTSFGPKPRTGLVMRSFAFEPPRCH